MFKRAIWLMALIFLLAACTPGGETEETAVSEAEQPETAVTEAEPDEAEQVAAADGNAEPNERFSADKYAEYDIVTLLPRDAIPAIDNPKFLNVDEADGVYDPEELVIGVEFNGDARAYSVPLLSGHEIVNDTVGGEKIAVTW